MTVTFVALSCEFVSIFLADYWILAGSGLLKDMQAFKLPMLNDSGGNSAGGGSSVRAPLDNVGNLLMLVTSVTPKRMVFAVCSGSINHSTLLCLPDSNCMISLLKLLTSIPDSS